jgi:hypothetical protein
MIRLLWIPVTGTVAALIVILLTHAPREEEPAPDFPEPPPALPEDAPEDAVPDDAAEPEEQPTPKPPPPPPTQYFLKLQKDGSLVDQDSARSFADGAAVIAELAHEETRHRILLSNGEGVDEAALDRLVESLSARFQVRKVYRAPEKEK